MNSAEKQAFANDAEKVFEHPMMTGVIDELLGNLGLTNDGLARYGVMKVATYAAQIARAQALSIDPSDLRMTDEESAETFAKLAAMHPNPIVVVAPKRGKARG